VSDPFIDTDVLISFLTGDDPLKQGQAAELLGAVEAGRLAVEAPVTVMADAVYVLSSPRLYHLSRPQIQALLAPLVRLPGLKIAQRKADFGDAFLVASMRQRGADVLYSYDTDFDRIQSITRREPGSIG
jgi:predicted nucleic acid-binding protein